MDSLMETSDSPREGRCAHPPLPVLLLQIRGIPSDVMSPAPPQEFFIQSSTSKVYHTRAKCGSARCSIQISEVSCGLRPCKRCGHLASSAETKPSSHKDVQGETLTFRCLDIQTGKHTTVSIDLKGGLVECSCEAFGEGEVCRHIRFVLGQVVGKEGWIHALYEYGGLEPDQLVTFRADLESSGHATSGRRCFACQKYVHGLHAVMGPDAKTPYHKECFALINKT